MRERLLRWFGPVPLAASVTTVVVIGLLVALESLVILSLLEPPDPDQGTATQGTGLEPALVHGIFTLAWLLLHPLLMRRPVRYGLRVLLACTVWVLSAAAWVSMAAYAERHAAVAAEVHPFAWVFWSMVVLAALAPAVLVGALIGERFTGQVAARVERLVEQRARSQGPAA